MLVSLKAFARRSGVPLPEPSRMDVAVGGGAPFGWGWFTFRFLPLLFEFGGVFDQLG